MPYSIPIFDSISKSVPAVDCTCTLLLYFVFCFSNFLFVCFVCGMSDSRDDLMPPEPILNSREWIYLRIKKFVLYVHAKGKRNYLLQTEAVEKLQVKPASKAYRSEYFASGLTSGKAFYAYEKNHALPVSTFQFFLEKLNCYRFQWWLKWRKEVLKGLRVEYACVSSWCFTTGLNGNIIFIIPLKSM